MMRLILPLLLMVSSSALAQEKRYPLDAVPEPLKAAAAKGDAALKALQQKLLTRVLERMKEGGPSAAVTVCRDEAAQLTAQAAQQAGVALGRTSTRLRNPGNAAPAWVAGPLAAAEGKRAAEVAPAVFDLGDRVGVLHTVSMRPTCLACHGRADSLPPAVKQTLASAYPKDQATGYAEGDFRGFLWAEVKK